MSFGIQYPRLHLLFVTLHQNGKHQVLAVRQSLHVLPVSFNVSREFGQSEIVRVDDQELEFL